MMSLLLLNNFYLNEFKRRRKRRIVVDGSVTRYGPRTSCQSKLNIDEGEENSKIIS